MLLNRSFALLSESVRNVTRTFIDHKETSRAQTGCLLFFGRRVLFPWFFSFSYAGIATASLDTAVGNTTTCCCGQTDEDREKKLRLSGFEQSWSTIVWRPSRIVLWRMVCLRSMKTRPSHWKSVPSSDDSLVCAKQFDLNCTGCSVNVVGLHTHAHPELLL
jgi:hypothetical protein